MPSPVTSYNLHELNALQRIIKLGAGWLHTRVVQEVRLPDGASYPVYVIALGHLARLEELSLVQAGLSEVPEWVFGLGQLTTVYLGLNPIVRVALEQEFELLPRGTERLGRSANHR